MLELEVGLRRVWDLGVYTRGCDKPGAESDLKRVDNAIEDPVWWARLHTLERLMRVVRDLFTWIESCPCHGSLPFRDLPSTLSGRWLRCPMRGRRLPEVAAGDFLETTRALCDLQVVDLMGSFPADVPSRDKGQCLQEYERGRAHLLFQFSLKLSYFMEPPAL
eukprot:7586648-Alexandrium_andersonii.AAC.1